MPRQRRAEAVSGEKIGLPRPLGGIHGLADRGLGGEMNHEVRAEVGDQRVDRRLVGEVEGDMAPKLPPRAGGADKIGTRARRFESRHEVLADEACPSRYEHTLMHCHDVP